MDQKREALIAYLHKNLNVAQDQLAEVNSIGENIADLQRKIVELEVKLSILEKPEVLTQNIAEIQGFIDDLTIVEEPAKQEQKNVEEEIVEETAAEIENCEHEEKEEEIVEPVQPEENLFHIG